MKLISLFLALFLLISFSVTSFAVDLEAPEVVEGESDSGIGEDISSELLLEEIVQDIDTLQSDVIDLQNQVNEIESTAPTSAAVDDGTGEVEENPSFGIDEATPTSISMYALNPITPSDTSGFKSVMLSLIGNYDAVIVEYEYENNNGYTSYIREVQPDYVWLCSCAIFLVVIYCVFRIGGAVING